MRIRQVKPSFWSDPLLAELSETTRLFYIGLWMIADDAGWLRYDPAEIGRDLYGYEQRARRERRVAAMTAELEAAGRVRRHDCGHAEVPTLVEHQRLSGQTKQVRSSFNEHMRACAVSASRDHPQLPAGTREDPPWNGIGTGNGTEQVRNGTERNGRSAQGATTTYDPTEFQRLVPREAALGVTS